LQAYKQKNKNYFLKAYGYSLFLTIAAFFITNLDDGSSAYSYLIVSFLIFPFAKMLFDEMIGSNISFLLKKENVTYIDYYLFPLMILVYGLLYMFSLFFSLIGFMYFFFINLYFFFKCKFLYILIYNCRYVFYSKKTLLLFKNQMIEYKKVTFLSD